MLPISVNQQMENIENVSPDLLKMPATPSSLHAHNDLSLAVKEFPVRFSARQTMVVWMGTFGKPQL